MPDRGELQSVARQTWEQNRDVALADPGRLEALYSSRFYTAPQRQQLVEFCRLATQLLNAAQSYITLLTETEAVILVGVPETLNPRPVSASYCSYVVGEHGPFVVCNSVDDFADHPATTEGIRSYLGVPLINDADLILGSFCVADVIPRKWRDTDVVVLVQLAAAIVAFHEEITV